MCDLLGRNVLVSRVYRTFSKVPLKRVFYYLWFRIKIWFCILFETRLSRQADRRLQAMGKSASGIHTKGFRVAFCSNKAHWGPTINDVSDGKFTFFGKTIDFFELDRVSWASRDCDEDRQWLQAHASMAYAPTLVLNHPDGCTILARLVERLEATAPWVKGARDAVWGGMPLANRLTNLSVAVLEALELPKGCSEESVRILTRHASRCMCILERTLHWHSPYNHLAIQLAGLIAFDLVFNNESMKYHNSKLFVKVIAKQVCKDGVQVERCSGYHAIVLNLVRAVDKSMYIENSELKLKLKRLRIKMENALQVLSHPNGQLTGFNDTIVGSTPSAKNFSEVYTVRELNKTVFPESGLAALESPSVKAIFDFGPSGPLDHYSNHGHADGLSLEVSIYGERFVCDPGTPPYNSSLRSLYRGPLLHNAPQFQGVSACEHWGTFLLGRECVARVSEALPAILDVEIGAKIEYSPIYSGTTLRYVGLTRNSNLIIADGWRNKGVASCISRFLVRGDPDSVGHTQKYSFHLCNRSIIFCARHGGIYQQEHSICVFGEATGDSLARVFDVVGDSEGSIRVSVVEIRPSEVEPVSDERVNNIVCWGMRQLLP